MVGCKISAENITIEKYVKPTINLALTSILAITVGETVFTKICMLQIFFGRDRVI